MTGALVAVPGEVFTKEKGLLLVGVAAAVAARFVGFEDVALTLAAAAVLLASDPPPFLAATFKDAAAPTFFA